MAQQVNAGELATCGQEVFYLFIVKYIYLYLNMRLCNPSSKAALINIAISLGD